MPGLLAGLRDRHSLGPPFVRTSHLVFLLGNEAGDTWLGQQLGLNGVLSWPQHLGMGLSPLP